MKNEQVVAICHYKRIGSQMFAFGRIPVAED